MVVACDVGTTFVAAARRFAEQKGAGPAQVAMLERRLERLAQLYQEEHGVDVRKMPGSGAGGGLAGGLAALGASLVPGFELVADSIDLASRVEKADLVVSGEGFVDEHSFQGKAVGGVVELCREAGVPVAVVAVEVFGDHQLPTISLVESHGREVANAGTIACVEEAVAHYLRTQGEGPGSGEGGRYP